MIAWLPAITIGRCNNIGYLQIASIICWLLAELSSFASIYACSPVLKISRGVTPSIFMICPSSSLLGGFVRYSIVSGILLFCFRICSVSRDLLHRGLWYIINLSALIISSRNNKDEWVLYNNKRVLAIFVSFE